MFWEMDIDDGRRPRRRQEFGETKYNESLGFLRGQYQDY